MSVDFRNSHQQDIGILAKQQLEMSKAKTFGVEQLQEVDATVESVSVHLGTGQRRFSSEEK